MGIVGVRGKVGVGQLVEKKLIATWRWFLKSEEVRGRGWWQIGAEILEFGLLSDDDRPGKGFRER